MAAAGLESLAEIEAAVWRELGQAVRNKQHAWRVGVLATVDGAAADARSVVLRDLDEPARTLLIYTDARSPKAAQLVAHPAGTLVLWSEALAWQLRLRVMLSLETAGLDVSSRWARLKLTPAARDYLSPLPPGTLLDAVAPAVTPAAARAVARAVMPAVVPAVVPERQSRDHFAVLAAQVQSVDWLDLNAQGQRRALFSATGAAWITP